MIKIFIGKTQKNILINLKKKFNSLNLVIVNNIYESNIIYIQQHVINIQSKNYNNLFIEKIYNDNNIINPLTVSKYGTQIYNVIIPNNNYNLHYDKTRFPLGFKNILFRILIDFYKSKNIYPFDTIPISLDLSNTHDLSFYNNNKNKKYILKIIDSCNGQGIYEFNEKLINKYKQLYNTVFIQERFDINNHPLLINNKDIALRVYALVIISKKIYKFYKYPIYLIQIAPQEYNIKNINSKISNSIENKKIKQDYYDKFFSWENDNIYNLYKSTKFDSNYSNDQIYSIISQKIDNLLSDIAISTEEYLLKKQNICFQNICFDFCVDNKFNIYLCECNDQYGIQYKDKTLVLDILEDTINTILYNKTKKLKLIYQQ